MAQPETTDAALVAFELRWFELGGGPDEEIRDRFALEPAEFFSQVQRVLSTDPPDGVSPAVVERMQRVARCRRWLAA